jgi:glycosyltransferase involved in cell wall biosynthesis
MVVVDIRVIMINDCASVGETLIKYLPEDLKVFHLKRSRDFLEKTLKIAWRIFRSKGDIYHVHYLLHDCYITLKLGKKPIVGHVHGSDVRSGLKNRFFKNMVRYNLNNCDKILVSTPDVLGITKQLRVDAEYLPNPVDNGLFYPRPLGKRKGKIKVLIASSCNWDIKGTDLAIKALSKIKSDVEVRIIKYGSDFERTLALASSLDMRLIVLPQIPHYKMNKYYWDVDGVIDRFKLGSLGMVSLEAIACGRPVVTYVSSKYHEYNDFPLKNVNTIEKIISSCLEPRQKLWKAEHNYLKKHHNPDLISQLLLKIYKSLQQ